MKLYGHSMSPRYRRVAIACAELGLPVELVELNLQQAANRSPEYLAKNPMGKIPTFEEDDGWSLYESFAILTYLGEKYPERGLFPAELRARAEALRWMFWSAAHLDPSVVPFYVQNVINAMRGQQPDQTVLAAATKELDRYLPVLESHLGGRTWILGDKFSLVDVAVGATIDGLFHPAVKFDRSTVPNVRAWHGRLAERPSWSAGAAKK
ncbi:MAG: glutathione S-transferase family protein [Myxococcaceae bacterium]